MTTNPFASTNEDNPFLQGSGGSYTQSTSYSYTPNTPSNDTSLKDKAQNQIKKVVENIPGANITDDDLAAREAALEARERQIREREDAIATAKATGDMSSINPRPFNFPYYFNWYKYYPEHDIDEGARPLLERVKMVHYAGAGILAYNFLVCLLCLSKSVAAKLTSPATLIVLSLIYVLLVAPVSFDIVFMVFYNALKEDKALKYYGFLLTYGIYFLFFGFLAIGTSIFGTVGSVGWINTLNIMSGTGTGLVTTLGFVFCIVSSLFTFVVGLTWIQCLNFRSSEAYKKKAMGEFAGVAATFANDNKDEIAHIARENPDLVLGAANTAKNFA